MQLKTGGRYRSQVCPTEVVVVRALAADVDLTCGGHPMVDLTSREDGALSPDPALSEGTQLGKRYTDADGTIEVLVTKPGEGSLGLGTVRLTLKEAKPLPASD